MGSAEYAAIWAIRMLRCGFPLSHILKEYRKGTPEFRAEFRRVWEEAAGWIKVR